MKTPEEKEESRVASLLHTPEGKWFMRWLFDRSGVAAPVFQFDQGKTNTIDAAVSDGRRQTWIELNEISKKHENDE